MAQNPELVKLRLTQKFAHFIDGIDLSRVRKGEEIQLTSREAVLLVAEGWAEPLDVVKPVTGNGNGNGLTVGADNAPKRRQRRPRVSKTPR